MQRQPLAAIAKDTIDVRRSLREAWPPSNFLLSGKAQEIETTRQQSEYHLASLSCSLPLHPDRTASIDFMGIRSLCFLVYNPGGNQSIHLNVSKRLADVGSKHTALWLKDLPIHKSLPSVKDERQSANDVV